MSNDMLDAARRAYAKKLVTSVQGDERLERAFATVRREAFLGSGPWKVFRLSDGGYADTPSADAAQLYSDDLFAIAPERKINNGQPSFHAYLLRHAAPREGEHVVHVGAGVGYYSAIMAELVGPSGRLTAIEFEPDIAARARTNLASYANARVLTGDGSTLAFEDADVIYVNAGATRPAQTWLDRLKDGGRLVLPLTTAKGFGVEDLENAKIHGGVFLISRDGGAFFAQWISLVVIYPCAGMRDEGSERALAAAFAGGGVERVRRLYLGEDTPAEQCWMKAPGWSLAYS
jgi:protein-L-isoaspartate(D-aspartate) O-methyltransferase